MMTESSRTGAGPLSKAERTRRAILAAARDGFARQGYEGATIRGIAEAAGIDPALVIRYFGSKESLFARATRFDLRLPPLEGVPPERRADVLLGHFLDLWESEDTGPALRILLRSAAAHAGAAERIRDIFAAQVLPAVAGGAAGGGADPARRAALVASTMLGLAMTRYVLALAPVAGMSREELRRAVAPAVQHYLTGDLG